MFCAPRLSLLASRLRALQNIERQLGWEMQRCGRGIARKQHWPSLSYPNFCNCSAGKMS